MINNLCEIFDVKEDELFNINLRYGGIKENCRIHRNELQISSCYGFVKYQLDISELRYLNIIKNVYCPYCGTNVKGGNYCPICGLKINEACEKEGGTK